MLRGCRMVGSLATRRTSKPSATFIRLTASSGESPCVKSRSASVAMFMEPQSDSRDPRSSDTLRPGGARGELFAEFRDALARHPVDPRLRVFRDERLVGLDGFVLRQLPGLAEPLLSDRE